MKAQIRKELLRIILTAIFIVVVYSIGSPLYAATKQQSTSESFALLTTYLQEFVNSDKIVSEPLPYYIDQGYFLMVCLDDESSLCICRKDLCKKNEPISLPRKFEGKTLEVIGNRREESINRYVITGDPSRWPTGHRNLQNVIFKRASPEDELILIIDCSTGVYTEECEGEPSEEASGEESEEEEEPEETEPEEPEPEEEPEETEPEEEPGETT